MRSKALKCLASVVQEDPTVLSRDDMQQAINYRWASDQRKRWGRGGRRNFFLSPIFEVVFNKNQDNYKQQRRDLMNSATLQLEPEHKFSGSTVARFSLNLVLGKRKKIIGKYNKKK